MTRRRIHSISWLTLTLALAAHPVSADHVTLHLDAAMAPPEWALLERQLLRANTAACA